MKVFLFLLVIYLVIKLFRKEKPLDTDIILAPGGYKGIYMMGICHYLKNHFPTQKKSITGFSCGSFISLFMRLNPALDDHYLRCMFALDRKGLTMPQLLNSCISTLQDQFVYEDFDLRQTQVGVTTSKGLELFKDFNSFHDLLSCCKSSSFIPFITHPGVFLFYKNKLTLDGGFCYKKIKRFKKKDTLLITSSMFGRYSESLVSGLKKPKCSYYQLYLYGYRDAQKNHDFFNDFFHN
jgi:hypothetical protein